MEVKIKKLHTDAVIPKYAKEGDAGMDLYSIGFLYTSTGMLHHTGLAMEIPPGYVGLIFPRSSISKTDLSLANCVGVIDSGYRGEIMCAFDITRRDTSKGYEKGDRIAQIIILPYPKIEFTEVEELDDSERGEGGFGSSGQ